MSGAVERIEAALGAMEAAAKAATPGPWQTQHGLVVWANTPDGGSAMIAAEMERENAEHIIVNQPTAVLNLVAGLRVIVGMAIWDQGERGSVAKTMNAVLAQLAAALDPGVGDGREVRGE